MQFASTQVLYSLQTTPCDWLKKNNNSLKIVKSTCTKKGSKTQTSAKLVLEKNWNLSLHFPESLRIRV